MKSNTVHTALTNADDPGSLVLLIKKEKEILVSMFLTNATIAELAEKYKLIDDLNARIAKLPDQ